MILLGVLLGRFICGFLCPFGWFQELLHKILAQAVHQRLKPLRYVKYAVLLIMVMLLPVLVTNELGMRRPVLLQSTCARRTCSRHLLPLAAVAPASVPLARHLPVYLESSRSADRYRVQRAVFTVRSASGAAPLGAFYALLNPRFRHF